MERIPERKESASTLAQHHAVLCGIKLPLGRKNTEFIRSRIPQIRLKDTDILIASYPRAGSTLTSQMLSLLTASPNELHTVNKRVLDERVCFMDTPHMKGKGSAYDRFIMSPAPRLAKTHLPLHMVSHWLFRDRAKVILVIRNPRDTLVSYFHYHKVNPVLTFPGSTWDEFFECVMADELVYGDIVDFTCGWWLHRHEHNVLVLRYEDILTDKRRQMERIAKFVDCKPDDGHIESVLQLSSFSEMRKNESTNSARYFKDDKAFIRQGKIGQWKKDFTAEQNKRFEEKYGAKLSKAGLTFDFDYDKAALQSKI